MSLDNLKNFHLPVDSFLFAIMSRRYHTQNSQLQIADDCCDVLGNSIKDFCSFDSRYTPDDPRGAQTEVTLESSSI